MFLHYRKWCSGVSHYRDWCSNMILLISFIFYFEILWVCAERAVPLFRCLWVLCVLPSVRWLQRCKGKPVRASTCNHCSQRACGCVCVFELCTLVPQWQIFSFSCNLRVDAKPCKTW